MVIGEIEIIGIGLEIFNKFVVLLLDWNQENFEEQCLCYCYLDLCCLLMSQCLQFCVKVMVVVCCYLEGDGFLDIEMFILMKVIFEGVCDYLVLSWMYKGEFFVLL